MNWEEVAWPSSRQHPPYLEVKFLTHEGGMVGFSLFVELREIFRPPLIFIFFKKII